jgi:predicted Zn-dependent protease
LKDYDEAIEHYKNLYDEYPYIREFFYSLVQAYAKGERRSDAVEVLETWLLSNPNDSQAVDWLSILSPPPTQ